MVIEIKIDISKIKFGESLANTEMALDSDCVEYETLQTLVSGMLLSTFNRAEAKVNRPQASLPPMSVKAKDDEVPFQCNP